MRGRVGGAGHAAHTRYESCPPLRIAAYSDHYDLPEKKYWGDFWLKEGLLRQFKALGYPVDEDRRGVLLHLFGEPLGETPRASFRILWIHSHPDWISADILRQYDKIYCISASFCKKIEAMGFSAEWLMIPTSMTPVEVDPKYDIVFVGNTKQGKCRKIIRDLRGTTQDVKIWGWGWKGLVPDEWIGGEYCENEALDRLYAAAKIVVNDHHDDMGREGFLNPRILDVLASGGFVVSDRAAGIEEFFQGAVPVYDDPPHLLQLIDYYLTHDEERKELSRKGQTIALHHTYLNACETIVSSLSGWLPGCP